MKLRIFEEPPSGEKEVVLRLVEYKGNLCVCVVDDKGVVEKGGYLVSFTPDGRIARHACIDKSFGFQLTPEGRIVEIE